MNKLPSHVHNIIMPQRNSRTTRAIREAEGYLELGLPEYAAMVLRRRQTVVVDSARANYLLGEALREVERYNEAAEPLERAIELMPEDMHASLALAWCYKRTGRLKHAIETLEVALESDPREAILHYNLACYWSLARNRRRALRCLSRALDLDGNYLDLVPYESDFDAMRDDPDFQLLTSLIV
ncbi:TPR end-of-group domain-containing protein [Aeoliella mucimassa]|uniref:TPR end-of-group domain-containing protein n=1 Tax=Aeoliella mucimassa TaxID=2527972 RepID=UPI0018D40CF9|nr:tetratricopeptide repeat protein [Aeoliella mucimassa]